MDITAFFDAVGKVFVLVAGFSSTALLSIVGLVLLLLAGVLAYVAVKSKPDELSPLIKIALFLCLIGGMTFSAAGPSLALFYVSENSITRMSPERGFDNLENNSRVNYVVRLISYDPNEEPGLGIDRLVRLGPPDQLFSFVASYDELVGYRVKDALEKIGQGYIVGNRVSAIIFPLRSSLFPANARGLLQVIQEVEGRKDIQAQLKQRFLQDSTSLNDGELRDLKAVDVPSYRVENFKDKYRHYCELTHRFNCETSYSARTYVGGLYRDWHPLGFSQKNPPDNPCSIPIGKYCEFSDWKKSQRRFPRGIWKSCISDQEFGNQPHTGKNLNRLRRSEPPSDSRYW